jgi:spore coat protein U-like protein
VDYTPREKDRIRDRPSCYGVEALTYNLYLDAARTIVWGDGSGGSQMYLSNNPPKSADVQLTVYGKIDSFQDVSAGSYADTVTVTVNF